MQDEGLEGNETLPAGLLGPLSAPLLLPPELPPELPPKLQPVNWPCSKASWVKTEFGDGLRGLGERILTAAVFVCEYYLLRRNVAPRDPSRGDGFPCSFEPTG